MSNDDASVTSVAGPSVVRDRTPDLERGMVLAGRYQVEAIIGKGGSGIVLRAFDRTAQAVVAVKVLKQELVHDERWSKRFSRELRLGRPIRHPNVCRIFDIGEGDGYRFLTMEIANGGTLRDLIKRGDPLRPLPERLADATAAIAGLTAIHEAGIVHRDVKPDNMLRMDDGRLVLSDFGLATDLPAAAAVTVMVGTPHYMAPEVRAGEPATTRSDVWALGVVLYEIFFGKRPERRSSFSSEGMSKPPAPLTSTPLERAMLALCERCLVENPMERPADAGAVARLFEIAQSSPGRFLRGRRLGIAAATLLILGVAAGIATRGFRRVRATTSPTVQTGVPRIEPTGAPADWSRGATTVTTVPGHVHCFSMIDAKTARLVWGTPRRAEDVSIATGIRTPSQLVPEAYKVGCPELSPRGDALLFATHSATGGSEIRLSAARDGSAAKSVTPGLDPLWLRNGEEFLYSIDTSHAAVFSLPTMSFTLLPDPGFGGRQLIAEKAAGQNGDLTALLLASDSSDWAVAVYEGQSPRLRKTFLLSAAYKIQFDTKQDLLISYNLSAAVSTFAALDWRGGTLRNVGTYPGLDLVATQNGDDAVIALGRHRSKDVWLYGAAGRRRLTNDGENFSATMSPSGDMLLGKRTPDGTFSIWWAGRDGALRQVSPGPVDVTPEFSPDGRSWVYVDYSRKKIMLCQVGRSSCSVLRDDEMLPTWPRFSPDGDNLAYVTQLNTQRLIVVSLKDGGARQFGAVFSQCPPVWSSPTRIWAFEGSAKHYFWSEREVTTGTKTGGRIEMDEAENDANGEPDEARCWPSQREAGSPFFPRLRIEAEETSRLLRLSRSAAARP